MKKRITALVLAIFMVMGTVAVAAGTEKAITVTPMGMTINGQVVTPLKSNGDAAEVFAYDGATYVPLRYLSELLGITVEWDKNDPNTAKLVSDKITLPAQGADGTFTGAAAGFGGQVTAAITMSGGKITACILTGDGETPAIGGAALPELEKQVTATGSADIDGVSGATLTSNAVREAVQAAINASNGAQGGQDTKGAATTDVVVIGGGGAGMTAALKVKEAGGEVILLEKESRLGGNTLLGSSVFNAAGSALQKAANIEGATPDAFAAKLTKANTAAKPEAIQCLADNSGAAADWLSGTGMDLTRLFNVFGHGPADGSAPGIKIVEAMSKTMDAENVEYRLDALATKILKDSSGAVCGVQVNNDYVIECKAVVVASGGFGANAELINEYDPRWKGLSFSCSPCATGEGTIVAREAGASLTNMTNVKVNPTAYYFDANSCMSVAPLRINGCMMVSHAGVRIVNEEGAYTPNSETIVKNGGEVYMILDQTLVDTVAAIADYKTKGYLVEANTLEELADKIDVDKAAFLDTCAKFTSYAKNKKDPDFGKPNFTTDLTKAPYYAMLAKPAVQGTFGGITTNLNAEVLDVNGKVIPGMYAAGECADEGTMGEAPLTVNVVFGSLAAESAMKYIKK